MKQLTIYFLIALSIFSTLSSKGQDSPGIIKMDQIRVKEFIQELRIIERKENHDYIAHTSGQADSTWITKEDIEFLMTLINSKDDAKCIKRVLSSYWPKNERTTIGDHAISLIECYRNKLKFPDAPIICSTYEESTKQKLKLWWEKMK